MTKKDKKIVEESEREGFPIFVISAKDACSLQAIGMYQSLCHSRECGIEHIKGVQERLDEFRKWQSLNPDKVKIPD